jgi:hypothetical protein
VAHFVEGLQGQDLATQMRFGEFKDAFILIERHPLGVGFAGARPQNPSTITIFRVHPVEPNDPRYIYSPIHQS